LGIQWRPELLTIVTGRRKRRRRRSRNRRRRTSRAAAFNGCALCDGWLECSPGYLGTSVLVDDLFQRPSRSHGLLIDLKIDNNNEKKVHTNLHKA
jgi:hypothetical protein